MERRTKAQWQALIKAQAESGKTATVFCREQGVNAKYFSLRRRQLSEAPEQGSSSFVPVSLERSGHSEKIIVCHPGGATLELPLGIEPRWLAQLLQALRDCPLPRHRVTTTDNH